MKQLRLRLLGWPQMAVAESTRCRMCVPGWVPSGRECAASWVMRALRQKPRSPGPRCATHRVLHHRQRPELSGDGDPTLGPAVA